MARERKPRKRRTRTAHTGVKIQTRTYESGETTYFARWRDPTTGREVDTNLSKLGLTSDEARRDWALRKAKAIAAEAASIEAGDEALIDRRAWSVGEAVEDFLKRGAERLEGVTIEKYRNHLIHVVAWAEDTRVKEVAHLTSARLAALKDWLSRRKKTRSAKGGGRGSKRPTGDPVSARTVNDDLNTARIFLNEARRLGRTPRLDRDAIADALSFVRMPRPRPEFLRPAAVRGLLEAALRHDDSVYTLTREEKAGRLSGGGVPRHEPIAPIVLFALLSGCRAGEVQALRFDMLHLVGEAPEIILPTAATKTRYERSIDLAVSPSLVPLLGALRVRSGGKPFVFGGDGAMSRTVLERARARLVSTYGATSFSWQRLRQTCDSVLNCAPGIYGGGAAFLAAKRLGHSVVVSERHYAGLLRDLPKTAPTIETALGIEDLAAEIVARASGGQATPAVQAALP